MTTTFISSKNANGLSTNHQNIFAEINAIEEAVLKAASKNEFHADVFNTMMTNEEIPSIKVAKTTTTMKANTLSIQTTGKRYSVDDVLELVGGVASEKNWKLSNAIIVNKGLGYKLGDQLYIVSDFEEKRGVLVVSEIGTRGEVLKLEIIEGGVYTSQESLRSEVKYIENEPEDAGAGLYVIPVFSVNNYDTIQVKVTKVDNFGAIQNYEIVEEGSYLSILDTIMDSKHLDENEEENRYFIEENQILDGSKTKSIFISRNAINECREFERTTIATIDYLDKETGEVIYTKNLDIGTDYVECGVWLGDVELLSITSEYYQQYFEVELSGEEYNDSYKFRNVSEEYTPTYLSDEKGTGATFLVNWGVADVVLNYSGFGYEMAPTVTFDHGNAEAIAYIEDKVIVDINVINPGSDYLDIPLVILTPNSKAIEYYQVWTHAKENKILDAEMKSVIEYFEDKGYSIVRSTNPNTKNTFFWHIAW